MPKKHPDESSISVEFPVPFASRPQLPLFVLDPIVKGFSSGNPNAETGYIVLFTAVDAGGALEHFFGGSPLQVGASACCQCFSFAEFTSNHTLRTPVSNRNMMPHIPSGAFFILEDFQVRSLIEEPLGRKLGPLG